jgi:hypothetical protein
MATFISGLRGSPDEHVKRVRTWDRAVSRNITDARKAIKAGNCRVAYNKLRLGFEGFGHLAENDTWGAPKGMVTQALHELQYMVDMGYEEFLRNCVK